MSEVSVEGRRSEPITCITVYPDPAVRDTNVAVVKTETSSSIQSISQASVEAELKNGQYQQFEIIESTRQLNSDRMTVKEFVPVSFQRHPNGPFENAYIRGNKDITIQYFTTAKDIVKTAPDYPSASFNDPMILERSTIRVRPLKGGFGRE